MAILRNMPKLIAIYAFVALFVFYLLEQKRNYKAKEAPLIDLIMKENSKLEEVIGKELANRKAIAEICKSYSKLSISQSSDFKKLCGNETCLLSVLQMKLPHLSNNISNLQPVIIHPSNRTDVWMVMGLSTVMREKNTYLVETVGSIIENIHHADIDNCLIIVLITELADRETFIGGVMKEFHSYFQEYLDSGLLEVVAIPEGFYPSLRNITPTFNDTPDRAAWRTKQNLDYIYLMMYCLNRGTYYLHLEDDITASPQFTHRIKSSELFRKKDWFILEFSKIGFIGKLFNKESLAKTIVFLSMFYNDKPCDWLLHHILEIHSGCVIIDGCKLKRVYSKPSLFQHVGYYSSLSGKIQKIKATDFSSGLKLISKQNSNNPPAKVTTSLRSTGKFSMQSIYDYVSSQQNFIFWADAPKPGDVIDITFQNPLCLEKIYMLSGSAAHPRDVFTNTNLDIKPVGRATERSRNGFVTVASIGEWKNGQKKVLSAVLGASFGPIGMVRVYFFSSSTHWIIIKKVTIESCGQPYMRSNNTSFFLNH